MAESDSDRKDWFVRFVSPTVAAIILLAIVVAGIYGSQNIPEDATVRFVAGLVVFVISLGALASLLSALGLSQHAEPFALPAGTIRALLAVGLLITFVVFSLDQLKRLSGGTPEVGSKLATTATVGEKDLEATLNRFSARNLVAVPVPVPKKDAAAEQQYEIHLYDRLKPADPGKVDDLAKQLLTIISTLLTTVIGFYFGSRATGDAARAAAGGAPAAGPLADATRAVEDLSTQIAESRGRLDTTFALVDEMLAKPGAQARTDALKPTVDAIAALRAEYLGLTTQIDQQIGETRKALNEAGTAAGDVAAAALQRALAAIAAAKAAASKLATLEQRLGGPVKQLQDATAEG